MLTTVTSFNAVLEASREIAKGEPVNATLLVVYPINETVSVVTDFGTDNLKLPVASVTVPTVVPFATMDTPGIGEPSIASVNLHVTATFSAIAEIEKRQDRIKQITLSKFLSCIKFGLSFNWLNKYN